jgi:hypothetical protein
MHMFSKAGRVRGKDIADFMNTTFYFSFFFFRAGDHVLKWLLGTLGTGMKRQFRKYMKSKHRLVGKNMGT